MDSVTRNRIKELISGVMERIIHRRTVLEPFRQEEIERNNPFGYRLVPIEIWKGSKFERSFVTSLGQAVYEQIAKIIAQGTGAYAENQHSRDIIINTWRLEKIQEILADQRLNQRQPDWASEIQEILYLQNPRSQEINVTFDLYIRRTNGREEFYSLKTVKPNLDQTEIAKRDMMCIKATNEYCYPYFALPFNPAGEGQDYRKIHSIPYKLFDMDRDECVLIGSAFWNQVGENDKTYKELLDVFQEVGQAYEPIIRRDYLGFN